MENAGDRAENKAMAPLITLKSVKPKLKYFLFYSSLHPVTFHTSFSAGNINSVI